MTCEEFRRLWAGRDPDDCTPSELTAVCLHYKVCGPCRLFMDRTLEEVTARRTPVENYVAEVISDVSADYNSERIRRARLTDPELPR